MGVFHEVCVLLTCRFGSLAVFVKHENPSWSDYAQLDAVYGAYEWEVLAARASSDLDCCASRARCADRALERSPYYWIQKNVRR